MKRGDIVVIDEPDHPQTPEQKQRAREWFKGMIGSFEERRDPKKTEPNKS